MVVDYPYCADYMEGSVMTCQCSCGVMLAGPSPEENLMGYTCNSCGKEQPQFKTVEDYVVELIDTVERLERELHNLREDLML